MDEIKRAIEVAELAPFRFLIQHIGSSNQGFDPHKFEGALSSIEHLRAFAKPLGVKLLLENIPNEISAPEKLAEMINALHYDDIGICFSPLGEARPVDGCQPDLLAICRYAEILFLQRLQLDRACQRSRISTSDVAGDCAAAAGHRRADGRDGAALRRSPGCFQL